MRMPVEVEEVITKLHQAGFEAFAVGGCVRDVLLHKKPGDWDVTTNAKPKEIQKIFPKSFYANRFGTVTVHTNATDETVQEIEVTTYRIEAAYSDQRHPDDVTFTTKLEEDLARRDFTVNAMALSLTPDKAWPTIDGLTIIDPFGGLKDLNDRLIRAVGDPTERFQEDALRLLRAVRFTAQLSFTIEAATLAAITKNAAGIRAVSGERVRDELKKIIMSDHPEAAFVLLEQTGLLKDILPEVQEGVGIGQNKHHIYTVFEHNVKSLQFAADYDYPFHVRLAALLHDIGKPRTKRKQGEDYTFYGHEIVGAAMAEALL